MRNFRKVYPTANQKSAAMAFYAPKASDAPRAGAGNRFCGAWKNSSITRVANSNASDKLP